MVAKFKFSEEATTCSCPCYLQKYFFFVSENSIPTKKAWFGNIFIKK